MSLGENIYRLRMERGMSQGDLAERLEVSRQSISKWETDSSVPELDKLLKLSGLFDVTLDELVTGEKPLPNAAPAPTLPEASQAPESRSGRRIAALILLCMGFLLFLVLGAVSGDFLSAFVLAIPSLACAVICFLSRKNAGLWCAWTVYILVTLYLNYGSSVQWSLVFNKYFYQNASLHLHLTIAYFLFFILLTLINITAVHLGRQLPPPASPTRSLLTVGAMTAGLFLSSWLMGKVFWWFREYLGQPVDGSWVINEFAYTGIYTTLDFVRIACAVAALTFIIQLIRSRKTK